MLKLRILFVISLVILGVLIALTVFRPIVTGGKYTEVQREQLLQTEDAWIIQFNIINREGKEQGYIISVEFDSYQYRQRVVIQEGKSFTYVHHIYRDRVTQGVVSFTIVKEGEETPFEQATYYLK